MRTVPLDITAPTGAPTRAPRTATDRCPTAIALHPAADGLIARVRLPGGRITSAQALVLADWADGSAGAGGEERLVGAGEARIELTVRGNLQIRGLGAGDAGPLAAALHDAGLLPSEPHDQARTIVASPLAGRTADAVGIDDLVSAIDEALCDEPELVALSGRFLIAVDDGSAVVDTAGADLALVLAPAAASGSTVGGAWSADAAVGAAEGPWFLLIVGGAVAGRVSRGSAPGALIAAARAFVRASGGAAWRVTELSDGGAAIRDELAQASVVDAAEPGRRSFARNALPPLGEGRQADGRSFVRAGSVLGRLTADQLRAAAQAAAAGGTDLRLATDRSLTLPDLAPKHAATALAALHAAGLVVDADDPSIGLTACAGLGCATTRGDVRAAADLRSRTRRPRAAREHLVGCERRCGAPAAGTTLVMGEHESPTAFAARAHALAEETTP